MASQSKGSVDVPYLLKAAELLREPKNRTYELMRVQAGQRVLDVGCGPGIDTIALARLVRSTGEVVGIDYDEEMLATANEQAKEHNVSGWTRHHYSDATSLPFESGHFDSCRSERLFQHLPHPEQVLAEMVRVTKPGGRIVILDADWGTASVDTDETDVERRLARVHAEHCLHNGYSGRQLRRLLRQQNLSDIHIEMFSLVILDCEEWRGITRADQIEDEALKSRTVSPEEVERWKASLKQADIEGRFFGSVSGVLIAGTTP